MKDAPAEPVGGPGLLRVFAYYAVAAAALFVLARTVPGIWEYVSGTGVVRLPGVTGLADAPGGAGVASTPWGGALVGAGSMLGALALMIPVTWIYMITRGHRGYEESVVHSLLVLPVAVTGIVTIVRDSVALAFSLAGIVAAVRFRTTLEDTKDAVYVFLAIGVGIAAGVQALGLALVLSLIFNAVVLALWATRFGNPYARAARTRGRLGLGDAQAGPGSFSTRRLVGDPAILDAASPRDIAEALERAARLERHLTEERGLKKRKRFNALVLVSTRDAAEVQAGIAHVLDEAASRWRLAEVVESAHGGWVLEYLARIEDGTEGSLVERLRNTADAITAVELRSLDGLRRRG